MSPADPIPARRRTLFDRIIALPEAGLASMEAHCERVEDMHGLSARTVEATSPGVTRVVAGATITERPDLVYAGQVAGGPVTAQAPTPDHPADLAKVGPARR